MTPATFFHAASDTWFSIIERGGEYFQRQYQIGFDGKQTSALEKHVDYVLGSGNHSKTLLSGTTANTLIELPLAWYAEKGGYWAMNPGYDRPDHPGFRRRIGEDCLFCHNAYPRGEAASGGELPHGIDCERCHGPGDQHAADGKAAIVNPARLTPARQAEVCMQCHLETTSSPLPNSILRFGRGPFSYRAGEPLADFKLFFDRAPEPKQDRFEINSSAYRLGMSACALKSSGKLTCSTCHNPHDLKHGEEGARHYEAVCRECHQADFTKLVAAKKHTAAADCVSCHMPKRRTDDVVHVVMTDHYIQRHTPTGDLLAERAERVEVYRGPVVPYRAKESKPGDELYLALAQVMAGSNLHPGIEQLAAELAKAPSASSAPWLQLADALRTDGRCAQALPVYDEARRRDAGSASIAQRSALCLDSLGERGRAADTLRSVPQDAAGLTELGTILAGDGKTADAIATFEKAVGMDPELPEAWNDLGGMWMEGHEPARAEAAFRNALRVQPNYPEAHNNLGGLLSGTGRFAEARYHFEAALHLKPDYNFARFNYGIALGQAKHYREAEEQFEAILKTDARAADARAADAHEALGLVLASEGLSARAIEHYREAVRIRPEFGRANLSLGMALVESGDVEGGKRYLRVAAANADPAVSDPAREFLRRY